MGEGGEHSAAGGRVLGTVPSGGALCWSVGRAQGVGSPHSGGSGARRRSGIGPGTIGRMRRRLTGSRWRTGQIVPQFGHIYASLPNK